MIGVCCFVYQQFVFILLLTRPWRGCLPKLKWLRLLWPLLRLLRMLLRRRLLRMLLRLMLLGLGLLQQLRSAHTNTNTPSALCQSPDGQRAMLTAVRPGTWPGLVRTSAPAMWRAPDPTDPGPALCNRQHRFMSCLLYTSPSPRDATLSRMPSSA